MNAQRAPYVHRRRQLTNGQVEYHFATSTTGMWGIVPAELVDAHQRCFETSAGVRLPAPVVYVDSDEAQLSLLAGEGAA